MMRSKGQGRGYFHPRLVCQVCGKGGHSTLQCYHRFDHGFQGFPTPRPFHLITPQLHFLLNQMIQLKLYQQPELCQLLHLLVLNFLVFLALEILATLEQVNLNSISRFNILFLHLVFLEYLLFRRVATHLHYHPFIIYLLPLHRSLLIRHIMQTQELQTK